jgi:transposase-like protein
VGRRAKLPPEFEATIVRLLAEPGATNESVGRDLGVSRETIRRWRGRQSAEAHPEVLQAREDRAELIALRRRVKVLEEELEILAKAAAFLDRETGRAR